jgi:hypothetical protein
VPSAAASARLGNHSVTGTDPDAGPIWILRGAGPAAIRRAGRSTAGRA